VSFFFVFPLPALSPFGAPDRFVGSRGAAQKVPFCSSPRKAGKEKMRKRMLTLEKISVPKKLKIPTMSPTTDA
jgi:hypothetical protein